MRKALVLSGGGLVGIAWETGLVSGLTRAGVNLGQADWILGTSAGSVVGVHLALGADGQTLVDPILAESSEGAAPPGAALPDLTRLMELRAETVSGNRDPVEVFREIGAFALDARTMDEPTYMGIVAQWLENQPVDRWPAREYACTALDAETGELRIWTRDSGVDLVRAIASSCTVPGVYPTVTVNGRRHIDGGIRSSTNADLATGYEFVVVIRVHSASTLGSNAPAYQKQFDQEVRVLKDAGATVVVISPDAASQAAMGAQLMDTRKRPGAARAGLAQGEESAKELLENWL